MYFFPARLPFVIAVASHNKEGEISDFSSRGIGVDIAASGEKIYSCVPGGKYQSWSGTSMASPFVSGFIALMLELNPTLSPEEIMQLLTSTAIDSGRKGKDNSFGYGIIDTKKSPNS